MLSFVFLFVYLTFQKTVNVDISGALQGLQIDSGDIYNLNAVGAATSAVSESAATLLMKGGLCTINGNGNTVTVSYPSWTSGSSPGYLMAMTGGTVTVNTWTFSATHTYIIILRAELGTQQITLTSCKFTGTASTFIFLWNVKVATLTDCVFENTINQIDGFFPLLGSVLSVMGGGLLTLTDSSFSNITAAHYSTSTGTKGAGAAVYIQECSQTTFSGVSFKNCTGTIAGAVFSYSAGTQTFTGLSFADNSLVIPDDQLISMLSSLSSNEAGSLPSYFATSSARGNDITRVGTSVTYIGACSTSPQPHYRYVSTTEDFEACKDAALPVHVPFLLIMLVMMAGVFLTIA